jgi:hypothetical protein
VWGQSRALLLSSRACVRVRVNVRMCMCVHALLIYLSARASVHVRVNVRMCMCVHALLMYVCLCVVVTCLCWQVLQQDVIPNGKGPVPARRGSDTTPTSVNANGTAAASSLPLHRYLHTIVCVFVVLETCAIAPSSPTLHCPPSRLCGTC